MGLWCWNALLAGVGLAGQYLAGRRSLWGWVVGLLDEGLWIAYGAWSGQWLFVASALVYGGVYARNLRAWRADRPVARRPAANPSREARYRRGPVRRSGAIVVVAAVGALASCSRLSNPTPGTAVQSGQSTLETVADSSSAQRGEASVSIGLASPVVVVSAPPGPIGDRNSVGEDGRDRDGPSGVAGAWAARWCPYDYRQTLAQHWATVRGLMSPAAMAAARADDGAVTRWRMARRQRLRATCRVVAAGVIPEAPRSRMTTYVQVTAVRLVQAGERRVGSESLTYRRKVRWLDGRWVVDVAVVAG